MEPTEAPDSAEFSADAATSWVSVCLSNMLARHGITARRQATEIAHICAISVSQARRKLRGAAWLFDEVLLLCSHFGESMDVVFSQAHGGLGTTTKVAVCQATLLMDGQRIPCEVELGPLCSNAEESPTQLFAKRDSEGWFAGTRAGLSRMGPLGPCYLVKHLQLVTPEPDAKARIAVLDDDQGAAEALTDWFNEVGYDAHAFTQADQLLKASANPFDAYVLDLLLGHGQTSQHVVEHIRLRQPRAPIVLLTGQLREGNASEATLATLLRTQDLTFFEKPVRPAMLTAAIQSTLDRLSQLP